MDKNRKKKVTCTLCHKENLINENLDKNYCTRCKTKLNFRKVNSITKTWALLIGALIFYIPANTETVMVYTQMGTIENDTILSGVYSLIKADLWPLAIIVFTASVFVPLAKILGLMFLLLSVQFNFRYCPIERTKLYVIVDIIGRWSMLDVFLISLMTGLAKLGTIADVTPGPGMRFFTAVVILTIFAALSFDPRLIWDSYEKANYNNLLTDEKCISKKL